VSGLDAVLPVIFDSNERRALRDTVGQLLDARLDVATALRLDATGEFPRELWTELGSLGLLTVAAPAVYSGGGGERSVTPWS